ncbi:MAG: hypothetical protein HFE63_03720 [Clostridiales bacterium]|nr:hypothetical protein [Clostridiales bacterium]
MKAKVREIITAYRKDRRFSAEIMLYINLGINFVYAVFEALCGYFQRSAWNGTLAFYYIILSGIRFSLLKGHKYDDRLRRWKTYRSCGVVILVLTIVLAGIHTLTISKAHTIIYHEYMIYAIAAYTFYAAYSAIYNVIVYSKINEPIFSASKALNLAVAAISMYNLQSAMVTAFGNDEDFRITVGNCVGVGVLAVIVWISVTMILKAKNSIKRLGL